MYRTPDFYKSTPTFKISITHDGNDLYDVQFDGRGPHADFKHRFSLQAENGATLPDVKIAALEQAQKQTEEQIRSLQETLNSLRTELRFERGDY